MQPLGRTAALALLLGAALAGCSGDGGGDADDDEAFDGLDVKATATTGVLRGVVVDDAVRPLAGARVVLTPGTPPREATTTELGAFAFDGLEPGTYFAQALKPGYLSAQGSGEVVAGVADPPIVKIVLGADLSFRAPYTEQFVFEGYIECQGGVGTPVFFAYGSPCSGPPGVPPPFPNDHVQDQRVISAYPDWVQAEMLWESTQAVSEWLGHNFYYPDPGEADLNKDLPVEGPSPLVNTMDAETAKEYLEGLDHEPGSDLVLGQRIFARATDGTGVAVTVQQRFTIYTTLFFGYVPPAGWTFHETGEIPAPPG